VGGFGEGLQRGLTGEPDGDGPFEVAGVRARCSHCGGEEFSIERRLLNTFGMTFLGLDFANRDAYVLTCKKCGHLEWFKRWPRRV